MICLQGLIDKCAPCTPLLRAADEKYDKVFGAKLYANSS